MLLCRVQEASKCAWSTMDSAIRRLEKDEAKLRLRYNALCHEEIIDEIEIIMLSVGALVSQRAG